MTITAFPQYTTFKEPSPFVEITHFSQIETAILSGMAVSVWKISRWDSNPTAPGRASGFFLFSGLYDAIIATKNEEVIYMNSRKTLRIITAVLVLAVIAGIVFFLGSGRAAEVPEDAVSSETPGDQESASLPEPAAEKGRKVMYGPVPVVELRGTWREMGRQYGRLMITELQEVYAFTELIIEAQIGNAGKADRIISTQTVQTPYRISEFFEGAAETSGFTVQQLQQINAVERIAGLPQCSAAMVWGDYAAGSSVVIGRNYDYSDIFSELHNDVAVTVYHPADGALATATIGYAGEIYAVNGINEKGIFLELNNGKPSAPMSSSDTRVTGTTMLFSALFECDELEDLDLFFNTVNCNSSYIINTADADRAMSFEWCPIGVKHGEQTLPDGLLVSTNYYVNPDWEFPVPTDETSWFSLTRRSNLIAQCEAEKGRIDAEAMRRIIDVSEDDGGARNELTVYQIVAEPETLTIWARVVHAPQSDWVKIDLADWLCPAA